MSIDIDLVCGCCGNSQHSQNITHNLVGMWKAAGCYDALYKSEGKRARNVERA